MIILQVLYNYGLIHGPVRTIPATLRAPDQNMLCSDATISYLMAIGTWLGIL